MNNFAIRSARPAGVMSRPYASKSVKNTKSQLPIPVKQFFKTHKDALPTLDRAGLYKLISGSDKAVQDFFLNYAELQDKKSLFGYMYNSVNLDKLFGEYKNYKDFDKNVAQLLSEKQKKFLSENVDHLVNFDRVDLVNLTDFLDTLKPEILANLGLKFVDGGSLLACNSLRLYVKTATKQPLDYVSGKLYTSVHRSPASKTIIMYDAKWQIAKGKEEYLK